MKATHSNRRNSTRAPENPRAAHRQRRKLGIPSLQRPRLEERAARRNEQDRRFNVGAQPEDRPASPRAQTEKDDFGIPYKASPSSQRWRFSTDPSTRSGITIHTGRGSLAESKHYHPIVGFASSRVKRASTLNLAEVPSQLTFFPDREPDQST